MSDFMEGGSKMTPKNRIIEGKNRIKGGSKMTQQNWTSFMHDPLFVQKLHDTEKKRFLKLF